MTEPDREHAIRRQELATDVDALSSLIATAANRSRELGVAPPRSTPGIIRAFRGWATELANADPAPREALTETTTASPASEKEPDSP
jgi:hypothetical protein